MVPDGWEKTSLENHINIKHGLAFKSDFFKSEGEYVLLTPGSFFETGGFRCQGLKTKYYAGDFSKSYLLEKGDLILAMTEQATGLLGSAAFIPENNKFLHNQRLGLVKLIEATGLSIKFLYWLYNSTYVRRQISEQSSGTKVKHTSPDKLKSITVLIPPLPEQQKIAQTLFTWDKAIEKLEALIAAKKKRKKALMQQLLTGKKRFSGFDKEWRYYYLGRLFDERRETKCYDLNLLSITREKGIILRDEVERKNTSNNDKSKYLRICVGDIGYNTMRMWQGVSAISKLEGIVSPAYTICIPKENLASEFIAYLFKTPPIMHLFQRYSQGLTSDTWSLKFHHFSKIKIFIPEKYEQQKIASVLSTADKEIETHQKQLEAFKQQKKGLMQQLLTGKKRVKPDNGKPHV